MKKLTTTFVRKAWNKKYPDNKCIGATVKFITKE